MTFDQWWKHIFGDKKIPDWIHETVVRHAYEAATKAEYEFECPRCGHCCQQKEWVGLTDEERWEITSKKWWDWEDAFDIEGFARAIEAKIKEKNT